MIIYSYNDKCIALKHKSCHGHHLYCDNVKVTFELRDNGGLLLENSI